MVSGYPEIPVARTVDEFSTRALVDPQYSASPIREPQYSVARNVDPRSLR
jgi:hypothetical protein